LKEIFTDGTVGKNKTGEFGGKDEGTMRKRRRGKRSGGREGGKRTRRGDEERGREEGTRRGSANILYNMQYLMICKYSLKMINQQKMQYF
jgi:hypothetical protein